MIIEIDDAMLIKLSEVAREAAYKLEELKLNALSDKLLDVVWALHNELIEKNSI